MNKNEKESLILRRKTKVDDGMKLPTKIPEKRWKKVKNVK